MLKNILCACALSSIITWTAFANENARDTRNPPIKAVIIEKEEIQDSKDEEMAPELDNLRQHLKIACEKCGDSNHRILALNDQQDESEKTTLKIVKKEEVEVG